MILIAPTASLPRTVQRPQLPSPSVNAPRANLLTLIRPTKPFLRLLPINLLSGQTRQEVLPGGPGSLLL